MRNTFFVIALLSVTLPALLLAAEETLPELAIVSRLGSGPRIRVFNREALLLFAAEKGKEDGTLLTGVTFTLYDHDGNPEVDEDVRMLWETERRWGDPPSHAELPLEDRRLPVGRYRLSARKAGWEPAQIDLIVARFRYFGLAADHEDDSYKASIRLRIEDPTEKRKAVKVRILVLSADGTLIDEGHSTLLPVAHREGVFEGGTVKISSKRKTPNRELPSSMRKGILKVTPGCRLALELNGVRFTYPIPLRSEDRQLDEELTPDEPEKREDGELEDASGRSVTNPPRKPKPRTPRLR